MGWSGCGVQMGCSARADRARRPGQRNMQARDARQAGAVRGPSVLEGEVRGNSARAIGGVRRRAAHDQVVDDTFMHPPA